MFLFVLGFLACCSFGFVFFFVVPIIFYTKQVFFFFIISLWVSCLSFPGTFAISRTQQS